MPAMNTPSRQENLSSQIVSRQTERSAAPRPIYVRFNLRIMAAMGAGLIVLAAFLPWVDSSAQALLGDSRLAPIIHGWPSLLIGLIALGVLALPQNESLRWVSLPAAALGLAAAVIAIVAAIITANALAETIAIFPAAGAEPIGVVGPGVVLTIVGGLVCVIAGLTQPVPAAEVRFDLHTNQPIFSALATGFILVALVAGAIGWWLASNRSSPPEETRAGFPAELLETPVVDAQITPLGVLPALATLEPTSESPIETPFETPDLFPTDTLEPLFPTETPTFAVPTEFAPSPTPTDTPSPTFISPLASPTATLGPSPLDN